MNYNAKNEDRKTIIKFLEKQEQIKALTAETKADKPNILALIKKLAREDFPGMGGSTKYNAVIIRHGNRNRAVVAKTTTRKGTTDWEALATKLALAQGYSMEDLQQMAEGFRRPDSVSETICWATNKQEEELGL